jgi:hypothetical protein
MVSGTPGNLDPGAVDRPVVAFDLGAEEKGQPYKIFVTIALMRRPSWRIDLKVSFRRLRSASGEER